MATWAQITEREAKKRKQEAEAAAKAYGTPEGAMPTASSALFQLPNLFALAGTLEEGIAPALGGIMGLGQEIDAYNQAQILGQLEEAMPGVTAAVSAESENIQDFLAGIVPEDVQESIARSSAFQALSSGFAGSPMARNLEARDLGLTSLDLMGRGSQQLATLLPTVRSTMTAQPYDIGVNIPTLSDLYNAAATQVGFNIQDVTSQRALAQAKAGAAQYANVGGGGGGGGTTVTMSGPNLSTGNFQLRDPGAENTAWIEKYGTAGTGPTQGGAPGVVANQPVIQNGAYIPFPGMTFNQPNPNWQDTAVVGVPIQQLQSAVSAAIPF